MRIIFRVDASNIIGTGHVVRCLTLADALRIQGARCSFVCREHVGNLVDAIRARGYQAHSLPLHSNAGWLGAPWHVDAEQTAQVMDMRPDWLVVDHYSLDWQWERQLRPSCKRLMVIDDLADRQHDCDLLLDQNWVGGQTGTRYNKLTPVGCTRLLGPRYALLKPEYAQLSALTSQRDGLVKRVLVFLGGSDPTDETAKMLTALSHPDFARLSVDVVLGVNHPAPERIAALARVRPKTEVHCNLQTLAGLMARADLMIGSGGTTTWERMSMGLPSIVVSIAANQQAINEALMRDGLINFIGDSSEVQTGDVEKALRLCLSAPAELRDQSLAMRKLVSANGPSAICKLMFEE